jgi:hypothetical protein
MSSDTTDTSVDAPVVVPRRRTLDGFVEAVSHTDGIGLADVDASTTLVGGAFFPERTRACLSGSSFGGSCLKLGWVGIGLHLEFHAEDQWIITSHVRSIGVEPSVTGRAS